MFVEKQTSNGTPGTVIAQNPQAGANVDRDTTITLTLAVQPPPPTTPPPTTEPPPTPTTADDETACYANTDTDQGENSFGFEYISEYLLE